LWLFLSFLYHFLLILFPFLKHHNRPLQGSISHGLGLIEQFFLSFLVHYLWFLAYLGFEPTTQRVWNISSFLRKKTSSPTLRENGSFRVDGESPVLRSLMSLGHSHLIVNFDKVLLLMVTVLHSLDLKHLEELMELDELVLWFEVKISFFGCFVALVSHRWSFVL